MSEVSATEASKHAFLLRHRRNHDSSRCPYVLHSLKVQSPLLRDVIRSVFAGYPGVSADVDELVFEAPFRPLFYRLRELKTALSDLRAEEAQSGEADTATKQSILQHLQLFDAVVSKELGHAVKAYVNFTSKGAITFEQLWSLYPPGSLVYAPSFGPADDGQIFKVRDEVVYNDNGRKLSIPCAYVDWDGDKFGWVTTQLEVLIFSGAKMIVDLAAVPMEFHPLKESLVVRMTERGRNWESLAGMHYRTYDGRARCPDEHRAVLGLLPNILVTSRIMVDARGYHEAVWWEHKTELEALENAAGAASDEQGLLTNAERMLSTASVKGYSFDLKQWAVFSVNCIQEVEHSTSAFNRLVLPQEIKDVIMTLSAMHMDGDLQFGDFVGGKGMCVCASESN